MGEEGVFVGSEVDGKAFVGLIEPLHGAFAEDAQKAAGLGFECRELVLRDIEGGAEGFEGVFGDEQSGIAFAGGTQHLALQLELSTPFLRVGALGGQLADGNLGLPDANGTLFGAGLGAVDGGLELGSGLIEGNRELFGGCLCGGFDAALSQANAFAVGCFVLSVALGVLTGGLSDLFEGPEYLLGAGPGFTHNPSGRG